MIELFRLLEKQKGKEVDLDFSGIKSMSRSLSNEYAKRREKFSKSAVGKNLDKSIRNLIAIASRLPAKSDRNKARKMEVLDVASMSQ